MKTLTKKILPIALALGIGVTNANAGGINLTPEGKEFRNFLFKEAIKGQINPNSRETNVNIYNNENNQPRQERSSNYSTGNIESVWTEYNVYKEGEKGMVIHTKFKINNHQGKLAKISAFFHHKDGRRLLDKDNLYGINGQVAISNPNLKPGYKNATYEDVEMFIPTSQLDIDEKGVHQLKFHVSLFDDPSNYGRKLAGSSWNYIAFTKNQDTVRKKVVKRRISNKSQFNNKLEIDDICMDKCYTLFKKGELKEGSTFSDCVNLICK